MAESDRFCLHCGCNLAGSNQTCSECGYPFYPDQPRSFASSARAALWHRHKRTWGPVYIALAALVIIWVMSFCGVFLWPIVLTGAVFLLARQRKYVLTTSLVALNPVVFAIVSASVSYANGPLKYAPNGFLIQTYTDSRNMDRDLRIMPTPLWSRVPPKRVISRDAYNFTLKLLVRTFGIPSHAYQGPYPDATEAQAAFAQGAIPVDTFELIENGKLSTPHGKLTLDDAQGEWLFATLNDYDGIRSPSDAADLADRIGPVEAVDDGEKLLMVRIPISPDRYLKSDGSRDMETPAWVIFLLDRQRGEVFAAYWDLDLDWTHAITLEWGRP
ncbi:MAG: hypothetical protein AAGI68_13330 [Planctomycetota bacterium]